MYFVYVIRQARTGYIKIGVSDDPEDRTRGLQTASPQTLELRYILDCQSEPDALKVERLLHDRYRSRRLEGEWFNIPYIKVIEDLDWCIEMANSMLGGNHYYRHEAIKQVVSKTGKRKTASRYDARIAVQRYLVEHPDAVTMSVRELASVVGVSKTIAHEELTAYRVNNSTIDDG